MIKMKLDITRKYYWKEYDPYTGKCISGDHFFELESMGFTVVNGDDKYYIDEEKMPYIWFNTLEELMEFIGKNDACIIYYDGEGDGTIEIFNDYKV